MCIMHILFSFRRVPKNDKRLFYTLSYFFSFFIASCGLRVAFLGGDMKFLEKNPIFDARFRFFPHL
jgi:hypothetical protein